MLGTLYLPSTFHATFGSQNGYFPSVTVTTSTNINVYWNGVSHSVTVPTMGINTWWFAAVVGTVGGALYLYFGPSGGTITKYTVVASGLAAISSSDRLYATCSSGSNMLCWWRLWSSTALTQAQVQSEAISQTPVTAGITYAFLSPSMTPLSVQLTDTVGGTVTLTATGVFLDPVLCNVLSIQGNGAHATSNTNVLPQVSSGGASVCGYLVTTAFDTQYGQIIGSNGKYPSFTTTNNNTHIYVFWGGTSYLVAVPAMATQQWYFGAVVGTVGGTLYFYWGLAGTTPVQYTVATGIGGTTATDIMRAYSSSGSISQYSEIRYWTATALSQAQVNAEASSLLPQTAGLTNRFLASTATTLGGLLTDTVTSSTAFGGSNDVLVPYSLPPTAQLIALGMSAVGGTALVDAISKAGRWSEYIHGVSNISAPLSLLVPTPTTVKLPPRLVSFQYAPAGPRVFPAGPKSFRSR